MSSNFIGYILAGLSQLIMEFLHTLPPSQPVTIFETSVTLLWYAIAPIMLVVGSFINLWIVGPMFGLVFLMESARLLIACWRMLLKLLPAGN